MSIGTLVRYTLIPLALGVSAFAAIVTTGPNPDDLSPARILAGFAAWVGIGGAVQGGMFLADRKRLEAPPSQCPSRSFPDRKGPDCDRCGNPTEKPFLYRLPNQYWRCEPCERKVTDILFSAAAAGTLTESMLRYTRPFPTDRTTDR